MSWKTIIEMHANRYDRDTVELTDEEEMNFLIDAITSTFLHLRRDKVKQVVVSARKELNDPCATAQFVTYVSAKLSQVQ